MASGFSTYWSNLVLNKSLRGEDFTVVSSFYVGAFQGASAAAVTSNLASNVLTDEVSTGGTGYGRVEVRGSTGILFSSSVSATSSNTADIEFAAATGAWGTVYALALLDASSGGNVVCYGEITPQSIVAPNVLRVITGNWDVTL